MFLHLMQDRLVFFIAVVSGGRGDEGMGRVVVRDGRRSEGELSRLVRES